MMKLEKSLSDKDLSVFKTVPMRLFAKHTIQYQNFKTKNAIEKMGNIPLTYNSARTYFDDGRMYVKYGKKSKRMSKEFVKYLDEWLLKKIQPLTPSKEDKRIYKPTKQQKTDMKPTNTTKTVTKHKENLYFAFKSGNKLTYFKTIDEVNAYNQAIKDYSNKESIGFKIDAEIVQIEIKSRKDNLSV